MKNQLLKLLCLLSFIFLFSFAHGKDEKNFNILFVGNNYTAYNDVPNYIAMLATQNGMPSKVDCMLSTSTSLRVHIRDLFREDRNKHIREKIEAGAYDAIILQDQSQLPYYSPEETVTGVEEWRSLVPKDSKTRIILFVTWAHLYEGKFDHEMQDAVNKTYQFCAKKWGCELAQVGEAWRRWLSKSDALPLHDIDDSLPNAKGSYLTAMVLYAQIYGKNPAKGDSRQFQIDAKEAARLQRCATAPSR